MSRQDNMEALFDEVAAALREKIRDPKCPPAVLSAAVKFLQNNEITAIASDDDSLLSDLRDALPDHLWEVKKNV